MNIFKKVSLITVIIICVLIGKSFAATGKVTASAVRIRREMSTESDIITNAYQGDEIEILSEEGDWYRVKYQDSTGYVKKEFVETSGTSNTNSNTQTNTTTTSNSNANSNVDNNTNTNTNNNSANNTSNDNNNSADNLVNNETTAENNNTVNDSGNVVSNSIIGLKLNPNLMSITVAQFEAGKELTKLDEINNWIKVTDGTVTGWITKVKVSEGKENTGTTGNTEDANKEPEEENNEQNSESGSESNETRTSGIVNVETANVRAEASSTSERIGFLDYNDTVTIIAVEGDWYKINYENTSGYVSKDLITLQENRDITSRSITESRLETNNEVTSVESEIKNEQVISANNGVEVAEYAKQYLGTKYIVGGKTPEVGFDCSGFTRYVYSNFGYNLGTTSISQSSSGTEVSRESMQIGDLIIFYNEEKSNVGHTAIYIGDGNFIHSANPERGVVIDNLNTNTYYNERLISARRIVE